MKTQFFYTKRTKVKTKTATKYEMKSGTLNDI